MAYQAMNSVQANNETVRQTDQAYSAQTNLGLYYYT